MPYRDITAKALFSNQVTTGTTVYSAPIDLGAYAVDRVYSLQMHVQTKGTSICAAYLLSNDGQNYIQSTDGWKLKTGTSAFHNHCGKAGDGRNLVSFTPGMAARMKIAFWDSVGTSPTGSSITAWLGVC